jgi:hypothetical protein
MYEAWETRTSYKHNTLQRWIDDQEALVSKLKEDVKKNPVFWSSRQSDLKIAEEFPHKMRAAVAKSDIQSAVTLTDDFLSALIRNDFGRLLGREISNRGRKAVNKRHGLRWTEDKKDALKRDFLNMRPQYKSVYAFCQAYSELLFHDDDKNKRKKKWRQIQTQLRKMELID